MDYLKLYKLLLPKARAWRITVEKNLRKFFEGLTDLPADVREFVDLVYLDVFPQTTRELEKWEDQFNLPDTPGLTIQERRDRLEAAWAAQGGQDPRYIQDTLQAAGFPVYVHEWWEPASSWPNGPPVARNPNIYLDTGATKFVMADGDENSQDGDELAQDGGVADASGYLLVNRYDIRGRLGDGSREMQTGGFNAQDGAISSVVKNINYVVPSDPAKWPFFLYIGGQTFPDTVTLPASRRTEFELLVLKICPSQLWKGILVEYI